MEDKLKRYKSILKKYLVFRIIWNFLCSISEYYKYKFAKAHTGINYLGIAPFQVYPRGNNIENFYFEYADINKNFKIIEKKTPLSSIGSCFSEQYKFFLVRNGYNYLITEKNEWTLFSSCAWGRQYTTANLLQVFEYTFGDLKENSRLYETDIGYKDKGGIIDAFRDYVVYKSINDAKNDLTRHQNASFKALTTCQVLIITLGQNEAWLNKDNNSFFVHNPPKDLIQKHNFEFVKIGMNDNIENLERIISYLNKHNNKCKIILTITPVASHATYVNRNIVDWSIYNRSILIATAREIEAKHNNVFYFPGYEMIMTSKNPFLWDNRHIKKKIINKVMSLFERYYVKI